MAGLALHPTEREGFHFNTSLMSSFSPQPGMPTAFLLASPSLSEKTWPQEMAIWSLLYMKL